MKICHVCKAECEDETELCPVCGADLTVGANELIDEAERQGIIKRDEASRLHKLRMCRNGLQHPEKRGMGVRLLQPSYGIDCIEWMLV